MPQTPKPRCRERASGVYGTAAYFITTVGWDFLPMRVAPTALFAVVTYWVMGLRPGLGRVVSFFGVLVLVNLAGTAMSMAVGGRPVCSGSGHCRLIEGRSEGNSQRAAGSGCPSGLLGQRSAGVDSGAVLWRALHFSTMVCLAVTRQSNGWRP
jgi:ABC-2 type transporter